MPLRQCLQLLCISHDHFSASHLHFGCLCQFPQQFFKTISLKSAIIKHLFLESLARLAKIIKLNYCNHIYFPISLRQFDETLFPTADVNLNRFPQHRVLASMYSFVLLIEMSFLKLACICAVLCWEIFFRVETKC